jgi:hypothetical protein
MSNTKPQRNQIAVALLETLTSLNVSENNWEAANLVDSTHDIAQALHRLATSTDHENTEAAQIMAEAVRDAATIIADGLKAVAQAIHSHGTHPKAA